MAQLPLLNVVGAASNAAATVNSNLQGSADSQPYALIIVFDVTLAGGAAPTVQLVIEAFDPVSQKFIAWGTALAAIAATGTACYIIGPNTVSGTAPAAAGGITAVIPFPVPAIWRVRTVAGGTIGTASFTVTGYVLPFNN